MDSKFVTKINYYLLWHGDYRFSVSGTVVPLRRNDKTKQN